MRNTRESFEAALPELVDSSTDTHRPGLAISEADDHELAATLHRAAGRLLPALLLPLLAAASAAGALVLQWPVLTSEPLFALMNAAVTASMVTLGTYMTIQQRERFTGLAFIAAGVSWPLIALDIYAGWGAYVAFVFGGGSTFFVPLCWGILRYGRPELAHRSERLFLSMCGVFTSGTGAVFSLFAEPEWVGMAPDANWPTLWSDRPAFTVGALLLCLGFNFLALYFLLLVRRMLREAPPTRRGAIRPLCTFGAALGIGSSAVFSIDVFDNDLLGFHSLVIVIGALALSLTAGLGVAMTREDLVSARFIDHLPDSRTPESVTRYLREVLQDESCDLFFVEPGSGGLIDTDGRRRLVEQELHENRFYTWIYDGSGGSRIGLLTGHPLLRNDTTTLASLRRVVTILAENARLQAVLRMQVAQLTAARISQQLAFEQAREEFHRDLHDGVQQTIAAARMDVDALAEVAAPEERANATEQLDAKLRLALEQVHSLKKGVHPPELRFGLKPAIDRVVAELRLVTRCRVTNADLGVLTLPVYYLARESLTNVYKHAQAGKVDIQIETDGRTIDVTVRDDGVGGATDREHRGISGMRRRVDELGGQFEINSPPGIGTTMKASVPCVSS